MLLIIAVDMEKSLISAFQAFKPDEIIISATLLKGGAENTNYLIKTDEQSYVLRIFGDSHSILGVRKDSDIEYETSFMIFLKKRKYPVPKLFVSKNGRYFEKVKIDGIQKNILLQEYIEGT
ncbi:MAG: phosphotransferase, partial [Patescibacteria group bacterium]